MAEVGNINGGIPVNLRQIYDSYLVNSQSQQAKILNNNLKIICITIILSFGSHVSMNSDDF